jgi:hypothetical protein
MRAAPFARTLRLPLGRGTATPRPAAATVVATVLVVCAIVLAVGTQPEWVRWVGALALVGLASLASRLVVRRPPPPRGFLVVDGRGVRRMGAPSESATLVDWEEPFGATVHASADRATFLIALTTRNAARFVSARVVDAEDVSSAPTLIERATTAADSDLRVDESAALTAADAETLLRAIARRVPSALDRMYLSDACGGLVTLERGELAVGGRRIDLSAPLEWRASIFQERGVHAASVCQATWVRQGDAEVVLVAPLAGDGNWVSDEASVFREAGGARTVRRSVARDLRLMQAVIADPPPRELRCAIDRLFMLPLRRVLDGAPHLDHARGPRPRSPRASHP